MSESNVEDHISFGEAEIAAPEEIIRKIAAEDTETVAMVEPLVGEARDRIGDFSDIVEDTGSEFKR